MISFTTGGAVATLPGRVEDDYLRERRVAAVAIANGRVALTTHDRTSFWKK